jgi:hypothetical protein
MFFENKHIYGRKVLWIVAIIACTLSVEVYLASQTLGPLWKTTGWPRELTATPVTWPRCGRGRGHPATSRGRRGALMGACNRACSLSRISLDSAVTAMDELRPKQPSCTCNMGKTGLLRLMLLAIVWHVVKRYYFGKSSVFCDVTQFSPLKVNRRFGGTFRLHLQGWRISQREAFWALPIVSAYWNLCVSHVLSVFVFGWTGSLV